MPRFTPSTIAASVALLGLGAVGGYAASSGQDLPASTAAPVEVRTQIDRRVVHVTRHVKARRSRRPDRPSGANKDGGTTTLASGASAGSPVSTRSSGGGSSSGSSSGSSGSSGSGSSGSGSSGGARRRSPVRTKSSGGGSPSGSGGGSTKRPATKRPAPKRHTPVRTGSSGAGTTHPAGGREHENEHESEKGDD